MIDMFPENSYLGKCNCGAKFASPKGTLHCANCLYSKIAEIEEERDALKAKLKEYVDTYFTCKCRPSEIEAHNLEQQAKGLTDYAKTQEQGIAAVWMISAASKLLNQAKALKEQGK